MAYNPNIFQNDKYKIRDGELDDDYIIRMGSYHDSDRLTWDEIADIINANTDLTYTESRYRKFYGAYVKGIQASSAHANSVRVVDPEGAAPASPEDFTTEWATGFMPKSEDEELRDFYSENAAMLPYYNLMRKDARFERFYKTIASAIKQLDVPDYIGAPSTAKAPSDNEYVLTLADLHIGAKFVSVNNEYSLDIVKDRFNTLFSEVVDFIYQRGVGRLNIVCLGDIIQGLLRISDLKLNEVPVVESFIFAIRIVADFLNKLSAYCNVRFYNVCYSNHAQIRPLGTKASEMADEDLGRIFDAYLRDTLAANDRIEIISDTEHDFLEFELAGFNCIALHGHQIKSIDGLSKDLTNRNRKLYDYIFVGHTHSGKCIINAEGATHNCMTLVAPSFIGSCPYADRLMVGSKAGCDIYKINTTYGLTGVEHIILN